MRGKSEKIESIHFAEKSGFSSLETEKEVLPPITQLWERNHSYNTCQLEIDHVTQKPKETCQSTCGGALMIYSTVNHQKLPFSDPTHPPL